MAFLNKGIKITLEDRREGRKVKKEFHYEGGIKEFVAYMNSNKEPVHNEIVYFEAHGSDKNGKGDMEIEIAFQYVDRYSELITSYANNINTVDGGYHLSGFKSALTRVFNDYAKKNKLLKDNDPALSGDDVREGITAVVYV